MYTHIDSLSTSVGSSKKNLEITAVIKNWTKSLFKEKEYFKDVLNISLSVQKLAHNEKEIVKRFICDVP